MARSSACAVGSRASSVRLPEAAMISLPQTMTAPTGTSPRAAAARASANARDIGSPPASCLSFSTWPCYQSHMPDRNLPDRNLPDRNKRRAEPQKRPREAAQEKGAQVSAERAERGERIAKLMARAGLCSRREAGTWIDAGRVAADGRVMAEP